MLKTIAAITLLFNCAFSFAQDDMAKSAWITAPIKVDGNPQEWSLPLRYYDRDTKLFFAFANDDKNLYLCFQTPDAISQMKIMRAGMKVTLSAKGKHKASILFPLAQKASIEQGGKTNEDERKMDRQERKLTFLAQNTVMEVKGFATKNGVIAINDNSGINAAINWDDENKFTYEISIPLKELFGADYTASDILKDISLDAEINAVKGSTGGQSGYSGGGGRMGGGGGGRMGGGGKMGGGMHRERNNGEEESNPGQTSADRAAMFEKSEMKEKFILATVSK